MLKYTHISICLDLFSSFLYKYYHAVRIIVLHPFYNEKKTSVIFFKEKMLIKSLQGSAENHKFSLATLTLP